MKILRLAIKNVNSLAGSWQIDFENEDFLKSNVFCISGPTGSGKSSILDAICLGLYGQTPRQNKVSSNTNEIMTRDAKDSQVKVIFKCHKGRFEATWYQKRSRKNSNNPFGEIQWSLRNVEEDRQIITTSSYKAINTHMTSLLNLDFDQFSKAVILAQGQFNNFLKSDANERAIILEKLGGDRSHRELAKAVYQKYSAAKDDVDRIVAKIGDIHFLSPEEREMTLARITDLAGKQQQIAAERAKLETIAAWYKKYHELVKDAEAAKDGLAAAEKARDDFSPRANKLQLGLQAQKVASVYQVWQHALTNLTNVEEQLARLQDKQKHMTTVEQDVTSRWRQAHDDLGRIQSDYAAQEQIWPEVLNLDTKLQNITKRIEEADVEHRRAAEIVNSWQLKSQQVAGEITQIKEEIDQINEYLANNSKDAKLVSDLSLMEIQLEEWLSANKDYEKAKVALSKSRTELQDFDLQQKVLISADQRVKDYLANHLTDGQIGETLGQLWPLKQELDNLSADLVKLGSEREKLQKSMPEEEAAVREVKDEIATNQATKEAIVLQDIPLVVEELQARIEEGEPCPVCGAIIHQGIKEAAHLAIKTGQLSDLANKLREVNADLDRLQIDLVKCENKLAESKERLTKITTQITEIKQKQAALMARIRELLAPYLEFKEYNDLAEKIATMQQRQSEFAEYQSQNAENDRQLQDLKLTAARLQFGLEQKKEAEVLAKQRVDSLTSTLGEKLKIWQPDISAAQFVMVVASLKGRKEQFQTRLHKNEQLSIKFKNDETYLQDINESLAHALIEMRLREENKQLVEQERGNLQAERQKIYGDRNVAQEQKTLRQILADVQKKADKIDGEKGALERELADCAGQKSQLEDQKRTVKEKSHSYAEKFKSMVAECGFKDEADFLMAKISDDELDVLRAEAQAINDQLVVADNHQRLCFDRLKEHNSSCQEEWQEEELGPALTQLNNEIEAVINQLSEEKAIIRKDDEDHKLHQRSETELTIARQLADRWATLQKWFGQKSGDDFVKFVQTITFRTLLRQANKQMATIYPRFELIADNGLDLKLKDHDNCDLIRPISNISGGESFLVSLSLALGIAALASKNIQIDSLFLDEGFGTLDGKKLQSTINALRRLQADHGKTLGIITHVDLLKDEMPVKIEVVPSGNGHSVLTGAGVSRGS